MSTADGARTDSRRTADTVAIRSCCTLDYINQLHGHRWNAFYREYCGLLAMMAGFKDTILSGVWGVIDSVGTSHCGNYLLSDFKL